MDTNLEVDKIEDEEVIFKQILVTPPSITKSDIEQKLQELSNNNEQDLQVISIRQSNIDSRKEQITYLQTLLDKINVEE